MTDERTAENPSIERLNAQAQPHTMMTAEHVARYRWTQQFIGRRRVLDAGCGAGFGSLMLAQAGDGPVGLISILPWNPRRLRRGNYIDALVMLRRRTLEALGGYSTDPRLHGWEDYDLWARLAESGGYGAFVPEIVARYRVGASSMLSLTNVSTVDAFAAVIEHAPGLMKNIRLN